LIGSKNGGFILDQLAIEQAAKTGKMVLLRKKNKAMPVGHRL